MLRHLKSLWLGNLIVLIVAVGPGRGLMAQEPHKARESQKAVDSTKHAQPDLDDGEHATKEEAINPMEPKPTLAIFSLVVFVVLFIVLTRYAWKPLLEALHKREAHLEHVLLETERARNQSESLMAEHRTMMGRANDEVRAIMEKARLEAQSTAESIVKQAHTEAEAARQRAQREIASARDQALAEIWEKTAEMAVSVAGRVLSKELSTDDHRRLLDAAIQELPAVSTNGHGGTPI